MSNTTNRKSVTIEATKNGKLGPINLLTIEYKDSRVTTGVSEPGALSLFGFDRAAALKYFEECK